MSLFSATPSPNFPATNSHRHATTCSGLFPNTHKKTETSFTSTIATPLTHFVTSNTYKKRAACCVARPTFEPTADKNPEPEKNRKKGGSWLNEANLFWFLGMLVLAACAPFVSNEGAVRVAVALAFLNGFGVTLGYHRLLTHRGFKVPKWLEYFFAYCGAHALQRDPIVWVSTHKLHHKHADTEKDPHTPTKGIWFSHIGWFLYNDYVATKCAECPNVSELKSQGFYRFLHDTYFWHPTALAVLMYLYGGFPYLAWGMGMRISVLNLVTYIETWVNHLWGARPWNTPDTSTNNWWVALLCLGEGWHNNHHAFPKSARHGLEWWQLDLTWVLIKFLEFVGLATDVKLPTKSDRRRMASLGSNQGV